MFPDAARAIEPLPGIGDDRTSGFARHRHLEPMLSLDKSYTEAELRAFLGRVRARFPHDDLSFVVEPKFDGLALSVTYEKGELVRATTRGNGREGDDVTANVLAIRGIPRQLRALAPDGTPNPIPDLIEVRGEIFLRNAEFQRINHEQEAAGEPLFSNPRNLAAGTLKQHDPREVSARGLEAVFYGWGAVIPATALPATQTDFHSRVQAWGLPGVAELKPARTDDEVWAAVQAIGRERIHFGFPTDGAVVKLDSVALHRELGASDSAPRWAMAYKFSAERAETTVRAITLQVGRTGALTPVAELAPVCLAGSTITRASLYNREEIARRDLRIGDTVILEKAGEIVPAIIGVNAAKRSAESRPFVFPAACPACGAPIVTDGPDAIVRCPNRDCPAQVRRRVEHFASKAAVDIPGLGVSTIETLVAKGWVKEIPDLYRLQREQLLTLGRNVEVSTDRLLASIEASKRAELWRFIHGLGIPHVGAATARELARRYGSLPALAADAVETRTPGDFAEAPAGEATTRAIADYFCDPHNRSVIADLVALGVKPAFSTAAPASREKRPIAGKVFVLTGTLPSLTRQQASARIEAAGGKMGANVNRTTDFVLAGSDAGEQLKQAKSLGIQIIDEPELLRMLECE